MTDGAVESESGARHQALQGQIDPQQDDHWLAHLYWVCEWEEKSTRHKLPLLNSKYGLANTAILKLGLDRKPRCFST